LVGAEEGGVRADTKALGLGRLDGGDRFVKDAVAIHREVVALLQAIHVNDPGEVARRRELLQAPFQQDRVGAEVDVDLSLDQLRDDLGDLGVQ
jgi:DNA-binding winged helix-turn-helix (wHTH) protein